MRGQKNYTPGQQKVIDRINKVERWRKDCLTARYGEEEANKMLKEIQDKRDLDRNIKELVRRKKKYNFKINN